jgi:hypothetical protein
MDIESSEREKVQKNKISELLLNVGMKVDASRAHVGVCLCMLVNYPRTPKYSGSFACLSVIIVSIDRVTHSMQWTRPRLTVSWQKEDTQFPPATLFMRHT